MSTLTTAWEQCPGGAKCILQIAPKEKAKLENSLPDFLTKSQRHFVLHLIDHHLKFLSEPDSFFSHEWLESGELETLRAALWKAKKALHKTGIKLPKLIRTIHFADGSMGRIEGPTFEEKRASSLADDIQCFITGIENAQMCLNSLGLTNLWIKGRNEKTTEDAGLDTILGYLVALMNFVCKQNKLDLIAEIFDAAFKRQSLTKDALKLRLHRMPPGTVKSINERFTAHVVPLLSNSPK